MQNCSGSGSGYDELTCLCEAGEPGGDVGEPDEPGDREQLRRSFR